MSKSIELPVLTNYNSLDTIIEELEKLRKEYGGHCAISIELESIPYEDSEYPVAYLET